MDPRETVLSFMHQVDCAWHQVLVVEVASIHSDRRCV
jgi:hypothetical protein